MRALRNADCLLIHAGAGLGVDSGLPDFRGPQGFWRAYPPMEKLGLKFSDVSNPASFRDNPAFGWGFFGHRYQLYSTAVPHEGYHVLRSWGPKARLGHFVFTSNVDGHFLKAGFDEDKVVECHGTVHYLQPFDTSLGTCIWPAAATLAGLRVSADTFLLESPLPTCPPAACAAVGSLARPNVLMFADGGWDGSRTEDQERRHEDYLDGLPALARVVVIEIGAGTGVPTVRYTSECVLSRFRNATLLRINPGEPQGPARTVSIPVGGKEALLLLNAALGGADGIGAGADASTAAAAAAAPVTAD